MKVAVLSESSADEAAIRVLVDATLSVQTEIHTPRLRSRGWPAVLQSLAAVVKHLYYQTDVDGLVVVADANASPMHDSDAGQVEDATGGCRLCQLREEIRSVTGTLRAVHGRSPLRIAIGLAVPSIEAWYLCGEYPQASEAAWVELCQRPGAGGQLRPWKLDLKRRAYGVDRPSLSMETERAVEHARRLATNIESLTGRFPSGFGTLADNLREWLQDQDTQSV